MAIDGETLGVFCNYSIKKLRKEMEAVGGDNRDLVKALTVMTATAVGTTLVKGAPIKEVAEGVAAKLREDIILAAGLTSLAGKEPEK